MTALAEDLALALELADLADEITLARFRADDLVVETKPDLTPVSEADQAVERALRDRLATVRPADAVVGEEYGVSDPDGATRRWIVDPIDGTKSYVRGVPVWGTLLALQDAGELVVGVVSAPALGRRWWASRGGGAFTRDPLSTEARQMRVSAVRDLSDAQLCIADFGVWQGTPRLERLLELSACCWRTRGYGDFWQHMLVAEGAVEIAVDPGVSLWDLAAPMLVVREAGGTFSDLSGAVRADGGDGVASNGLLHEAALRFLGSPGG